MSFETRKWVRIMSDYAADGIWDDESLPCDPEDLLIHATLTARIHDWQAWYDRDCTDCLPVNGLDVAAFAREGLAIARAVKAALPDWTVFYYDEAKAKEYRDLGLRRPTAAKDRLYFEYEILFEDRVNFYSFAPGKVELRVFRRLDPSRNVGNHSAHIDLHFLSQGSSE